MAQPHSGAKSSSTPTCSWTLPPEVKLEMFQTFLSSLVA
ncbi:hypothetical protein SVIOM342S_02147 [Streptomyces violaceorubidus]